MRKLVTALFALSLLATAGMEAFAAKKAASADGTVKTGDPVVPAGRVVFDVRTGGNSNPCGRGEERPAADCDPPPNNNQVCCKWVNASSARVAPGRTRIATPIKGGGASPAGRIVYDTEKIDKGCPKGSQSVSDDHCEPRPKMNELCCKTQTQ